MVPVYILAERAADFIKHVDSPFLLNISADLSILRRNPSAAPSTGGNNAAMATASLSLFSGAAALLVALASVLF